MKRMWWIAMVVGCTATDAEPDDDWVRAIALNVDGFNVPPSAPPNEAVGTSFRAPSNGPSWVVVDLLGATSDWVLDIEGPDATHFRFLEVLEPNETRLVCEPVGTVERWATLVITAESQPGRRTEFPFQCEGTAAHRLAEGAVANNGTTRGLAVQDGAASMVFVEQTREALEPTFHGEIPLGSRLIGSDGVDTAYLNGGGSVWFWTGTDPAAHPVNTAISMPHYVADAVYGTDGAGIHRFGEDGSHAYLPVGGFTHLHGVSQDGHTAFASTSNAFNDTVYYQLDFDAETVEVFDIPSVLNAPFRQTSIWWSEDRSTAVVNGQRLVDVITDTVLFSPGPEVRAYLDERQDPDRLEFFGPATYELERHAVTPDGRRAVANFSGRYQQMDGFLAAAGATFVFDFDTGQTWAVESLRAEAPSAWFIAPDGQAVSGNQVIESSLWVEL